MGNMEMMKCRKCNKDSAAYRAEVRVCPQCHAVLDAEQLLKLLKRLGINGTVLKRIKKKIVLSKILPDEK